MPPSSSALTMLPHATVFSLFLVLAIAPVCAQTATTLYTFTGGADGGHPKSTLIKDPAGNLYGTTTDGGPAGNGTVFKIDTSQNFSVMHSFAAGEGHPIYGLVMDSVRNLYGTTYNGGASDFGTVFKIDPSGIYSVLHDFDGTGGSNPYGPLALDSAGSLYGTTSTGGAFGLGTVFEIAAANNYSVLHDFAGGSSDGSTPYSDDPRFFRKHLWHNLRRRPCRRGNDFRNRYCIRRPPALHLHWWQ